MAGLGWSALEGLSPTDRNAHTTDDQGGYMVFDPGAHFPHQCVQQAIDFALALQPRQETQ